MFVTYECAITNSTATTPLESEWLVVNPLIRSSIQLRSAQNSQVKRLEAGTFTVALDNTDGRFLQGAIPLRMNGTQIRLRAMAQSQTFDLFRGRVAELRIQPNFLQEQIEIVAVDGITELYNTLDLYQIQFALTSLTASYGGYGTKRYAGLDYDAVTDGRHVVMRVTYTGNISPANWTGWTGWITIHGFDAAGNGQRVERYLYPGAAIAGTFFNGDFSETWSQIDEIDVGLVPLNETGSFTLPFTYIIQFDESPYRAAGLVVKATDPLNSLLNSAIWPADRRDLDPVLAPLLDYEDTEKTAADVLLLIAQSDSDGIIFMDGAGKIVYRNPARWSSSAPTQGHIGVNGLPYYALSREIQRQNLVNIAKRFTIDDVLAVELRDPVSIARYGKRTEQITGLLNAADASLREAAQRTLYQKANPRETITKLTLIADQRLASLGRTPARVGTARVNSAHVGTESDAIWWTLLHVQQGDVLTIQPQTPYPSALRRVLITGVNLTIESHVWSLDLVVQTLVDETTMVWYLGNPEASVLGRTTRL